MGKNRNLTRPASVLGGMAQARRLGSVTRGGMLWLGVIALFTACTTERAPSGPNATQSTTALAQVEPGRIVIAARPELAVFSYDPPNARMESAGEGAGTAVRKVLDTPRIGQPHLEAAVGILEFTLTPFAAAYGAVSATQQRLPADKLALAAQDVEQALRSNASSEALRDRVADAARLKTHRLLVCAGSASAVQVSPVPVSAVLEVAVEQLRLKAAKGDSSQYVLQIDARARLLRSADGAVLVDRAYSYESGPAMFIDWSRQGGLEAVARTGYQSLAEQIAGDIFQPVVEPPLLIGPGQKHTSLRSSARLSFCATGIQFGACPLTPALSHGEGFLRTRSCVAPLNSGRTRSTASPEPFKRGRRWNASLPVCARSGSKRTAGIHPLKGEAFQGKGKVVLCQAAPTEPAPPKEQPTTRKLPTNVVELAVEKVAVVEVYSGHTDELLRGPVPVPGVQDSTDAERETDWAVDGLENDRNFVVQVAAGAAAIPIGLWENTVGAALGSWHKKTAELALALRPLPEREHFAEAVTDEVARCLRSHVINPVRRTEEPPRLIVPRANETRATTSTGPPTDCPLALQIQVVNTTLAGKHQNSRSRALCVEIQATVLRTSDGQELYSRPVIYRSVARSLKDWAAADAKLFRQELKMCSQQSAQAVSEELIRRGFVTPGGSPLDGKAPGR